MTCWSILVVLHGYVVTRLGGRGEPLRELLNSAAVADTPAAVLAHLILEDAEMPSGARECDVLVRLHLAPQLEKKGQAHVTRTQLERCVAEAERGAAA